MIPRLFCGSLMLIEIKCRVRTHESDSEVTVCQLGKIIQRIYFAQSGASIRTKAWKWSGETHFPGWSQLTAPGSPRMYHVLLAEFHT